MIAKIQEMIRAEKLDGWLFLDHHRRDPLAYRILRLPDSLQPSRRWLYLVPAEGDPVKVVHRIESGALDSLPGRKLAYSGLHELSKVLASVLQEKARVAMQYSPNGEIPYVSMVDAGTVEYIRSFGPQIVSSANLVQNFEARWTEEQFQSHIQAGIAVDSILREAFQLIHERQRSHRTISEFEVQQFIRGLFSKASLTTDHGPIVAVNGNASDPHYEPSQDRSNEIKPGDLVLIDLWAKQDSAPDAVYYDITWTGYCGEQIPEEMQKVFGFVREARESAYEFVRSRIEAGDELQGWQVDDVARNVISKAGYAEFFFHRTGHSIGTEVHGTGANMDNYEAHDVRRIIPNTCFSIEPGIYLPRFGIRSEVNVYVSVETAVVTGAQQNSLLVI